MKTSCTFPALQEMLDKVASWWMLCKTGSFLVSEGPEQLEILGVFFYFLFIGAVFQRKMIFIPLDAILFVPFSRLFLICFCI